MSACISQQALANAIERHWQDQTRCPQHKGWVKVIQRLTGMYDLLLWSGAGEDITSDCQILILTAMQHNIWESRNV